MTINYSKQGRKILLRNFEGSSSFKSGKRKEYTPGCDPIPTPENMVPFDVEEGKSEKIHSRLGELL